MIPVIFAALLVGFCQGCVPNTATTTTVAPATFCARRNVAIANNAAGVPRISAAFESACKTILPAVADQTACLKYPTDMTTAIRTLPTDAAKYERISQLAMNALGTPRLTQVPIAVRIDQWGTLANFADCTQINFPAAPLPTGATAAVPWPAKWSYYPNPATADTRQSATLAAATTQIQTDVTAVETAMKAAAPGMTFKKIDPPRAEEFVTFDNVGKLPDGDAQVKAVTVSAGGILTKFCTGNKARCAVIANYEDLSTSMLLTQQTGNATFSQMVAVQNAVKNRFTQDATFLWI